jgi:hypothetical protein
MKIRRLVNTDVAALQEIYQRVGYGFEFPHFGSMETSFVVEDERVIGAVGAKLQAEIIGVFDPDWGSPHRRMEMFAELHNPLRQQLKLRGVGTACVYLDPKFCRFGKRMLDLGWNKALWDSYWRTV